MVTPSPTPSREVAQSQALDLRALYYSLRERAWVLVLCVFLAGLSTAAYLARAPKIFAAKAVVQVEQEEAQILNIQRIQQENLQSVEYLKTVEQILQSRQLLQEVIDANNLAQDGRFAAAIKKAQPSKEDLVDELAKMTQIKVRRGTRLIDVRVEHANPALAELVANSIVTQYVRQNYKQSLAASQLANAFLIKEAEELKRKLGLSENALQNYKEGTKSASLEERQNVVVEKLKELSVRATEAKSERIISEMAYKQVQTMSNDVNALLAVPAVANDPTVVEFRSNIAKDESEIANLKQRYRPKHPKYLQAESKLNEWKRGLEKAVLNVPQRISAAYDGARASEQALEQALREQELAALALNKQAIHFNALARDVESDRVLYQSVLNRIKETSVTKDLQPNKIRIVQNATTPEKPIRPRPLRVAFSGIMAGIAAGLFFALFLNALDRSIKTVDQAEEYLGLPVLGAIPKCGGSLAAQQRLIASDYPDRPEAESFRTLRTALSMLGRKEDRRTFLFTSAVPSEGKTFCSLNFAASLARQGFKTLVVDCDLRRPMVEKALIGNDSKRPGLTDYLTSNENLSAVTHASSIENLHCIPAGTTAPNPAELLAKTGLSALIGEALQRFDRVVVDSAPIHAVSDTLLVLETVQTVCLVVRAGKTPKNSVRRALQLLQEAGAPVAGVVLNVLPRSRGLGYYYDPYYDYGYRGAYAKSQPAQSAA